MADPADFAYHPPGGAANNNAMTPDQFDAHLKRVMPKWTPPSQRDKPQPIKPTED